MTRYFIRKEKKGFLIYDSLDSEIFFVNLIGKEIIFLLEKNYNKEKIVHFLQDKYNNSSKEKIKLDVNNFLKSLKK